MASRDESKAVTVTHAANVLGLSRRDVDRYVSQLGLVSPSGRSGKGGQYWLGLDDLVVLDTADRLEHLRLPPTAICKASEQMSHYLREARDGTVAVIYTGTEDAEVRDVERDPIDMPELMRQGVSICQIDLGAVRKTLERRLESVATPRRRGRPSAKSRWVQEKLESSAVLGGDEMSHEELCSIAGERGDLPWRKKKTASSQQS